METKKICSKCKEEKEIELFWKDKNRKEWYTSACKECRRKKHEEYRNTPEWKQKERNCKKGCWISKRSKKLLK